jgi:LacI family transcriptional regulator
MVLEFTNPFYIPMVRAIEDYADEKNHIVIIGESRRDLEIEKHMIDRFRRIRASGVIITPVLSNLDHLTRLEDDGVPVVIAGRNAAQFDSINIDNFKSGRMAGEFFVSRGYQKVGFIQSGDPFNIPEKDRLNGFRHALDQAGIGLKTIYTVGNNRINGGEKAGQLWIEDKTKPQAVFCSNDLVAMGFTQYLVKLGVNPPYDVGVLGHDDIPFADTFVVPLSTISLPKYELGKLAIERLLRRISNPSSKYEPLTVFLEPELILRKSCIG